MGSNTPVLNRTMAPLEKGERATVCFSFLFPEIENGSYLIAIGVADGTPETHVRHQLVADAYEFQFLSTSSYQKQGVLLKLTECAFDCQVTRGGRDGSA